MAASSSAAEVVGGRPPGTPRLMLRKIVLENFKSYAGVVTIGPFHERFSAVVGPNGSGKSNVIDAMQFVFGKRAAAMRLKKISELIHKSENFPDLDCAKVSVHFHDIIDREGDVFEPVPGTEVVVTRAVYGNQSSKYFIDDKTSSYTEVTDLLKARGIDLDHNRSMVLQGEVEQIAMMKPKGQGENDSGLLEYLEDIIGSNKFVAAIESAFKATEALNEERTAHLHRVKIVEKEREQLEVAKNEAEACLAKRLMADVKETQLEMLQRESLAARREEAAGSLAQLQADNAEKSKAFARETAEVDALAAALVKQTKDVEKTEATMSATKKEFELYERKDIKHREDAKHLLAKTKKAEKALEKEEVKRVELAQAGTAAEAALVQANAAIAALTKEHAVEKAKLDSIYEALKGETVDVQAEIEQAQEGMRPHAAALADVQKFVSVATSERELLMSKASRAAAASAETVTELAAAKAAVAAKRAELAAAGERKAAIVSRLSAIQAAQAATGAEEEALTVAVRQLRARIEESKAVRQESDSKSGVLKALLAQKKKSKAFAGVIGRLGDLGWVDAKYDVAISTACPALDNIVVDTTETAQACVAFLRQKNAGRATFAILSELGYLEAKMSAAPPRGGFPAPRLFDLVRPAEPAYAPAFYHALRDTLVADSHDAARAAAFEGATRFRVVSLGGDLIDISGTMSGGGSRLMRGLMSSSETVVVGVAAEAAAMSAGEVAEAEAAAATKTRDLTRARDALEAMHREAEALVKEAKTVETALVKLGMDLEAAIGTVATLEARLAELSGSVSLTADEQARIDALGRELAARAGELETAQGTVRAYSDEIALLQKQILDRGGVKLQSQKARVEAIAQRLEMAEADSTKAGVTIKTAGKALAKAEASIAKARSEIEESQATMAKADADFKTIEAEALTVMTAFKAIQSALEQKQEAVAALGAEHDAKKKALSKLKTAEVEYQCKAGELERAVAEVDKKLAAVDAAVASLTAKVTAGRADCTNATGSDPVAADVFAPAVLGSLSKSALATEVEVLRGEVAAMAPNMAAIAEFREKESQYLAKVAELDEVTRRRDALRSDYDGLRKQRLDLFMGGFAFISTRLREVYMLISGGGDCELSLVDSLDPFAEGISFSVRPPKKSWKAVTYLSGGERTLSSLSLVFALNLYSPSPLFFFDEVDAALDFRNVSIIANYIKSKARDSQFVVVSLREQLFSMADRLVGIYKTQNTTKSIALEPAGLRIPLAGAN